MPRTKTLVVIAVILALVIAGGYCWFRFGRQEPKPATVTDQRTPPGNTLPNGMESEPAAEIDNTKSDLVEALAFDRFATKLDDDSEEGIIKRFGQPEKRNDEKVQSTHESDKKLLLRTLNYRGMSISVFKLDDRDLIQKISITDESYDIKYGLKIGVTEDQVLDVLGKPARREKQYLIYEESNGFAQVTFEIKDGRVASCDWYYILD